MEEQTILMLNSKQFLNEIQKLEKLSKIEEVENTIKNEKKGFAEDGVL